jgi:hypothetical protein
MEISKKLVSANRRGGPLFLEVFQVMLLHLMGRMT